MTQKKEIVEKKDTILLESVWNDFVFSTDQSKIDTDVVFQFLDQESYWAQGIPRATLEKAIAHSICLGVYLLNGTQVGFGRMITDRATFAYLADIFVIQAYRGKEIAKEMMRLFCKMGDDFGLRRFLLTTQDAHGLYKQYGFEPFPYPERLMTRKGVDYPTHPQ